MKAITSKLHKKQRNSMLISGSVYLVFGLIQKYFETDNTVGWGYVVIGIIMLTFVGYQIYTNSLFSVIKWDNHKLTLKAPEQKQIVFTRNAIKSIKLTDKSLTINAGMGNGEMLDLNYFKPEDLEFFKSDFVQQETTQAEVYNLTEA
ncbi:hypothetical protein [Leeuwenhoekiella marinoflava]|uniref:PH (Pleckstrin Homology) domain-containing protein n=2 Tax=Leeuwenhoekiella marinoflava TaxID=988 RepID=A0A4Q0PKM2_9FLAO|nr:hypothetical protein [Leeuwenhoekiella marinoflava]RXG29028.1 hypothetical protein DSL99_2263 [Leeuwenhoekiella marinoflava]SHF45895.1 hypothetical protein SAMN02745246_02553 [Leeuwenhoekiella marinoflava DSM 3653]